MKNLLCVCVAALHLSACTTLNTMPYTAEAVAKKPIREKENVVLTTKDYTLHRLFVTRVTPEEICENEKCIRTREIEVIQREELSVANTVGLILLTTAILAISVAGFRSMGNPLAGANFRLWGP